MESSDTNNFSSINDSCFFFQLFYTELFLNGELRSRLGVALDHKAEIFQNLNGAVGNAIFK